MSCKNWDQHYRYSFYLNLYLLYFDYYSQEFLGIGVSSASDVLNENFKHLTLSLCHQNPTPKVFRVKKINYAVTMCMDSRIFFYDNLTYLNVGNYCQMISRLVQELVPMLPTQCLNLQSHAHKSDKVVEIDLYLYIQFRST